MANRKLLDANKYARTSQSITQNYGIKTEKNHRRHLTQRNSEAQHDKVQKSHLTGNTQLMPLVKYNTSSK